mgnify:CR=1 FL=1|tara:strand:- start:276 stop:482 length:207 start_codon:yes stop_codon:yes gene_type:complete
MPETIEITYIRNAIDSIKERLDTIEKRLEITKVIATAMMHIHRDIKEAAEQAMIKDNTLGIGELDGKE